MMETEGHDPILLLHSSCTTGDDEGAAPPTENHLSVFELLEEQIVCDLLFLPEHPSSSSSTQDYRLVPKNPLNPCGTSNVLALELLPKHWMSGPILLSLSSCNILYHNTDRDNDYNDSDDEITARSFPLFVKPIPSTFVLDFSSNKEDFGGHSHNGSQSHSFITVKSMFEIHVAFDVRDASMQAKELFHHDNSTRINVLDDKGESKSKDTPKNHTDNGSKFGNDDDSNEITSSLNENTEIRDRCSTSWQYASDKLHFDEPDPSTDFKDRKLELAHLNAKLDRGTEVIDVIFLMSGSFCLFSMAVLLWVIREYYRTTKKSDRFSQEIRERMKASQHMLQMAVDELNEYHHRNLNEHHHFDLKEQKLSKGEHNFQLGFKEDRESENQSPNHLLILQEDGTQQLHRNQDNVLTDEGHCETSSPTTPKHGIFRAETEEYQTPGRFIQTPSFAQKEAQKKLCFIRPLSRHQSNSFPKPHPKITTECISPSQKQVKGLIEGKLFHEMNNGRKEKLLSPSSALQNYWNDEDQLVQTNIKMPSALLSPCSQLEKAWNEGKTIRRGNLKKRRQYLKPLLRSSNVAPASTSSNTAYIEDERIESTNMPSIPNTSKVHEVCSKQQQQEQQEHSCTIVGPPKLRSTARPSDLSDDSTTTTEYSSIDEQTNDHKPDAERRKMIGGLYSPPIELLSQQAPRLCYTPASEDDSFVDDYW